MKEERRKGKNRRGIWGRRTLVWLVERTKKRGKGKIVNGRVGGELGGRGREGG